MVNKISVIISVFNEEGVLLELLGQLQQQLERTGRAYEILFVNDGSSDASGGILRRFAREHEYVKVINFSRNYGHEAAMIAGIDYAGGDCLICMDADLQHPPAQLPRIVAKMEEGYHVISMIRTKNDGAGKVKNLTSSLYYKILNKCSMIQFQENASDFFALSKEVAEILREDFREKGRYLRGLLQGLGFQQTVLEYEADARFWGISKYTYAKLVALALQSLVSFSKLPLKLGFFIGGVLSGGGCISFLVQLIRWIAGYGTDRFWLLLTTICALSGLHFLYEGIMGVYLGDIQEDVKNRPIYLVESKYNLGDSNAELSTRN